MGDNSFREEVCNNFYSIKVRNVKLNYNVYRYKLNLNFSLRFIGKSYRIRFMGIIHMCMKVHHRDLTTVKDALMILRN